MYLRSGKGTVRVDSQPWGMMLSAPNFRKTVVRGPGTLYPETATILTSLGGLSREDWFKLVYGAINKPDLSPVAPASWVGRKTPAFDGKKFYSNLTVDGFHPSIHAPLFVDTDSNRMPYKPVTEPITPPPKRRYRRLTVVEKKERIVRRVESLDAEIVRNIGKINNYRLKFIELEKQEIKQRIAEQRKFFAQARKLRVLKRTNLLDKRYKQIVLQNQYKAYKAFALDVEL